MKKLLNIFILLAFVGTTVVSGRKPRNVEELTRCVRMAEPLVHNPEFVLPLTTTEIRNVCRMWGAFVDCVRSYTTHFLTPDQLDAFGDAIEPSMQSIHQLCAEDAPYREAYLAYAPCMKTMYISPHHCGTHYEYLADLVKGNTASPDLMCCAHHKFRSCVLNETPRECGTIVPTSQAINPNTHENGVAATHFVTAMLDRALGFLLQQCKDYKPTASDCPGFDGYITNSYTGKPTSPYAPTTSFTWTPPSNIYYNHNATSTSSSATRDGTYNTQDTERLQKNGFTTLTNFRRDFSNNRLDGDEPTSQQFRGDTSGACRFNSGGLWVYLMGVGVIMVVNLVSEWKF